MECFWCLDLFSIYIYIVVKLISEILRSVFYQSDKTTNTSEDNIIFTASTCVNSDFGTKIFLLPSYLIY